MMLGQVSAEWCLYLLTAAVPVFLLDVSHISLRNYLVSQARSVFSTLLIV